MPRDSQLIELRGLHRLIGELLADGLEVATPLRDRGIDLIAYADLSARVPQFRARPIQLKASSATGFSVDQKYSRIADLVVAYVWHLDDGLPPVTYALSYPEAVQVADQMGWTKTESWRKGVYTTTKPIKRLLEFLEAYRISKGRWWDLIVHE